MTKTNAQRLADAIERYNAGVMSQAIVEDYCNAASELRRLDAENAQLRAELERLQKESEAVRLDAERLNGLLALGACDSKHGGLCAGDATRARLAFRYWCSREEALTLIDAAIVRRKWIPRGIAEDIRSRKDEE